MFKIKISTCRFNSLWLLPVLNASFTSPLLLLSMMTSSPEGELASNTSATPPVDIPIRCQQ